MFSQITFSKIEREQLHNPKLIGQYSVPINEKSMIEIVSNTNMSLKLNKDSYRINPNSSNFLFVNNSFTLNYINTNKMVLTNKRLEQFNFTVYVYSLDNINKWLNTFFKLNTNNEDGVISVFDLLISNSNLNSNNFNLLNKDILYMPTNIQKFNIIKYETYDCEYLTAFKNFLQGEINEIDEILNSRLALTEAENNQVAQETAPEVQETAPEVQETAQEVQETAPEVQETAQEVQETAPEVQETAQEVQETAPEVQETAQEVQETAQEVQETAPVVQETAQEVQETAQEVQETAAEVQETAPTSQETAPELPQVPEEIKNDLFNTAEKPKEIKFSKIKLKLNK